MFKPFLIFTILHCIFIAGYPQSHAFPYHYNYKGVTIIPDIVSRDQMDKSIQSFYDSWRKRFIKSDAGNGLYYVYTKDLIKENKDTSQSLSEGQGYGMMITALMAGYDPLAHETFDGLYNYARAHPSDSSNFLMAWCQRSDFTNIEKDGASDGDLDIAYSLLLAHAQWGDKGKINYLSEAKQIILAIKNQEINPVTFSILKGNATESDGTGYFDMRASDFMPAHLRVFYEVTKDSIWLKIIDKCYSYFEVLQKRYSPGIGLLPDFIQKLNREPIPARPKIPFILPYEETLHDGQYYYNSCRVPWRIATDYILFEDPRAKTITDQINKWIRNKTKENPLKIAAGYKLNGNPISMPDEEKFDAMSYLAPFAVSGMTDPKNKAWVTELWEFMLLYNIESFNYYDNTIKLIDMIILSGNYWPPVENNN